MSAPAAESLFATCAPGLEPVLASELTELGLRRRRLFSGPDGGPGRVALDPAESAMMRANLLSRCADRILLRVGSFPAPDQAALKAGMARLPWERWLAPGVGARVDARCAGARAGREDECARAAARGIFDRLKTPGRPEREARVYLRVEGAEAHAELDTSGEPLHRRGWRLETAKAPLKETLAAALVAASGWDGRGSFLDPFCGSGTVAIEAALKAAGIPAGGARRFAFMDWPGFDEARWRRVSSAAAPAGGAKPRIVACDRDAGAVAAARANAERAGVSDLIEFSARALSDAPALPGLGWLATNPPYGERVSPGRDLRALYARLGEVVRGLGADWTAALLCADPALARATGLRFDAELRTLNGGRPVRLLTARPR